MKKGLIYIIFFSIISMILIGFLLFSTYSLFESNVTASANSNISKWNIKVNNETVTSSVSTNQFNIGAINWQNGNHVKEGKASPGSVGEFQIEIDPTDTEVSFYYIINIDTSQLGNDEFVIQSVTETNGKEFIRTSKNTYVGIAYLSDNLNGQKYNIKINIIWNDVEENNEKDYELGSRADTNIVIPIEITFNQYFGTESFSAYDG